MSTLAAITLFMLLFPTIACLLYRCFFSFSLFLLFVALFQIDSGGMFKFGSNLQVLMPSLVLRFEDGDDLTYTNDRNKNNAKQKEYDVMAQLYDKAIEHKTQAKHTQWFMSRLNYGLVFDAAASEANKLRQQELLQALQQQQQQQQQNDDLSQHHISQHITSHIEHGQQQHDYHEQHDMEDEDQLNEYLTNNYSQ